MEVKEVLQRRTVTTTLQMVGIVTDTDPSSVAKGAIALAQSVPANSVASSPRVTVEGSDCYMYLEYVQCKDINAMVPTVITENTVLARN